MTNTINMPREVVEQALQDCDVPTQYRHAIIDAITRRAALSAAAGPVKVEQRSGQHINREKSPKRIPANQAAKPEHQAQHKTLEQMAQEAAMEQAQAEPGTKHPMLAEFDEFSRAVLDAMRECSDYLRSEGYVIVMFSPEEIGNADRHKASSLIALAGSKIIDDLKGGK